MFEGTRDRFDEEFVVLGVEERLYSLPGFSISPALPRYIKADKNPGRVS